MRRRFTNDVVVVVNVYRRVEPASSTGLQRRDQSQQGGRVATIDPMQMWLLQPWHAGGDDEFFRPLR